MNIKKYIEDRIKELNKHLDIIDDRESRMIFGGQITWNHCRENNGCLKQTLLKVKYV